MSKIVRLRWLLLAVALSLWSVGQGGTAHAATLSAGSTFNVAGATTCTITQCGLGLTTLVSTSGDFNVFTLGDTVTMTNPFVFNPFTAGAVYTLTEGLLTTTFVVTSNVSTVVIPIGAGGQLTSVVDEGFATLTGFDPTFGTYVFTANQLGHIAGSFSASADPGPAEVPEPASLALLGASLLGLGTIRHWRKAGANDNSGHHAAA